MKAVELVLLACFACIAAAKLVQLEVAPYQVDCLGSIPTKCLSLRENSNTKFVNFKGDFDWFTFQEGIRSFIVADKTLISNPAPGYSNMKYIMKRSILTYNDDAKKPATPDNISKWPKVYYQPLDPSWNIDDSSSSPLLQPTTELAGNWFLTTAAGYDLPKAPTVKFGDKLINYRYCNSKGMSYVRTGNSIQIVGGFSTLMLCMWLTPSENTVNKAFLDCVRLQFQDYGLTCFDSNGQTVLSFVR